MSDNKDKDRLQYIGIEYIGIEYSTEFIFKFKMDDIPLVS